MDQLLSPEELGAFFKAIDCEPTGKLSELAKIAGLNLAEDYIGVDLSNENLSEDNLSGANFSNANLSNTNLSGTNLSNANLSGANLRDADLRGANLSNADLRGANLRDADLSGATLSGADLRSAILNNANLINLLDALAAAKEIQNELDRTKVLIALADKLPEVLPEALAAARAIQDESDRADALSALADKLPSELLPEALEGLNNLANLYSAQGRYTEAEPLFKTALSLRQRLLGEEHPDVATSYNNLANLYYSQGRYSEAEPLYKKALEASVQARQKLHLTEREQEVLHWLAQGASNEEIAKRLYVTVATVKAHLTSIFEKLKVTSRTQAIVAALKLDLIQAQ